MTADLSRLIAPASVAVLGASDRPGNLGGVAIRSMLRFGYRGRIDPVNPKQSTVAGLACHPDVADLPAPTDVVLLAIPAAGMAAAVEACAAAGIRHGIAWAGGFADQGPEGARAQARLAEVCRDLDFRLCGPNCLGIVNTASGFAGTFTKSLLNVDRFRPSRVAIVSQSGGLAGQAMGIAHRAGFGFSHLVSCGNEAVLTAADFARALLEDDGVAAIAMYLESVVDGAAFIDTLDAARRRDKPVIVLKGGASEASSRATLAHTGRLGGSDRAFDAVMREFAAIRVHSLEELIDTAMLVETLGARRPAGPGVAVTTFGGGTGVLAVDQSIASGLEIAPIPAPIRARMAPLMTPLASLANPVDLTPQSMNDAGLRGKLPEALALLPQAETVDSVLFLCASNADRETEMTDLVVRLRDGTAKPVLVSWSLATPAAEAMLAGHGIYSFPETTRATRALGNLVRRAAALQHHRQPPVKGARADEVTAGATAAAVATAADAAAAAASPACGWRGIVRAEGRPTVVEEHRVAALLAAAGVPVAPGLMVRDAGDLARAADTVPFPWAMKAISPTILHRAAAGLVALDIGDAGRAAAVVADFQARCAARGAVCEGVYVQQMITAGTELLVSAIAEPTFGPMLTVGAGGNLTELIDDVVMARLPVDEATALEMIGRLRLVRAAGERMNEAARREAARYVAGFSRWVASAPWPRFTLELNPVKCSADGAVAVDGLLVIEVD